MARSNRLMIEVTVGSRPIVTAMRVMGKFAPEPIGILRAVARRVVKIAHFRETFEKVYSGRWELVFMAALAEPEFANLPAAETVSRLQSGQWESGIRSLVGWRHWFAAMKP